MCASKMMLDIFALFKNALREQGLFAHQEIGQKKNAVVWIRMSLQGLCGKGNVPKALSLESDAALEYGSLW